MEKDWKKIAMNTEAEYNKLAKEYWKLENKLYEKNKEIGLLKKTINKMEKKLEKKNKKDI
jgi:hypothetical protein